MCSRYHHFRLFFVREMWLKKNMLSMWLLALRLRFEKQALENRMGGRSTVCSLYKYILNNLEQRESYADLFFDGREKITLLFRKRFISSATCRDKRFCRNNVTSVFFFFLSLLMVDTQKHRET